MLHSKRRWWLPLMVLVQLLQVRQVEAQGFLKDIQRPTKSSDESSKPSAESSAFDPRKTYFLKQLDTFYVASHSALNIHDQLPLGTYTVGYNSFQGQYYLKEILPFELPQSKKLYGDTIEQARRILDTFTSRRGKSTGVLLAGEKGSGKTLLAKYISIQAAKEMGISTIIINEAWSGEQFNAFIQSIQQPCIILMDEFEKVYRQSAELEATAAAALREERRWGGGERYSHGDDGGVGNPSQDAILTLLDGVYPSTMLFLLTVNDKSKITKNMMNRPGRIYYVLDFSGLDSEFVREYCKDTLHNQTFVTNIVSYASLFDAFSFDMLQALVEEMNRYDESPEKVAEWLNIKLDMAGKRMDTYLIQQLVVRGDDITDKIREPTWQGNPVTSDLIQFQVYAYGRNWMGMHYHKDWQVYFSPRNHLISGNLTSGEFILEDSVQKSKAKLLRARRQSDVAMAEILVS